MKPSLRLPLLISSFIILSIIGIYTGFSKPSSPTVFTSESKVTVTGLKSNQVHFNGPITVHFSPRGGCVEEVVNQINSSKKEIRILAYNFSSFAILDSLIVAKKRGVDIQCVVDFIASKERRCMVPELNKFKIPCYIDSEHRIAHQKVMIVDRRIVIIGSYNWSESAEKYNSENLLTVPSKELAFIFLTNWELHKLHSQKVE